MARYAKAVVAILAAAAVAAQNVLPLTDTQQAWLTVGIAVLGAVGVYAVPNSTTSEPVR